MQGSKGGAYEFNFEKGLQKLNPALNPRQDSSRG